MKAYSVFARAREAIRSYSERDQGCAFSVPLEAAFGLDWFRGGRFLKIVRQWE